MDVSAELCDWLRGLRAGDGVGVADGGALAAAEGEQEGCGWEAARVCLSMMLITDYESVCVGGTVVFYVIFITLL